MLKIKYYDKFKGDENFLLVTGDTNSYQKAISSLENLDSCLLPTSDFIILEDLGPIDPETLFLTQEECRSLKKICQSLLTQGKAAHDYFSTQSLPDVDFLISYGEYKTTFHA